MRRWRAIVFATALELWSEPLVLLVTLSAVLVEALAAAMHYHQFGESARMARDAGFSALIVGGIVIGAFAAIRSLRRELESGTAMAVLAHPVPRPVFFLAKVTGAALVTAASELTVAAVALTVVKGAVIGGEAAAHSGDIARMWGPSLALAVGAALLPLVLGALLNRFANFRFTVTANLLAVAFALLTVAYRFDPALLAGLAPAYFLVTLPVFFILTASAAAAAGLKANFATGVTVVALLLTVVWAGNYCLSDVLSTGLSCSWGYCAAGVVAIVPLLAAALLAGVIVFAHTELKAGE